MLVADYGGHGNSFHGSGGRGNKRSQMRFCLRLIRSMVSVGDDALNQDLVDQGAIGQVVGKLLFYSSKLWLLVIKNPFMKWIGRPPFRKGERRGWNSRGYKTCCCVVLYCGLDIVSVFWVRCITVRPLLISVAIRDTNRLVHTFHDHS